MTVQQNFYQNNKIKKKNSAENSQDELQILIGHGKANAFRHSHIT